MTQPQTEFDHTRTSDGDVYVVETPRGFTETFNARTIETLLRLGLIEYDRSGFAMETGSGNGVGPEHHYFTGRAND